MELRDYVMVGLSLFMLLLGALCTVLWQMLRDLRSENKALREDFADLSTKIIEGYVAKPDFHKTVDGLKSDFREVVYRLESTLVGYIERIETTVNQLVSRHLDNALDSSVRSRHNGKV